MNVIKLITGCFTYQKDRQKLHRQILYNTLLMQNTFSLILRTTTHKGNTIIALGTYLVFSVVALAIQMCFNLRCQVLRKDKIHSFTGWIILSVTLSTCLVNLKQTVCRLHYQMCHTCDTHVIHVWCFRCITHVIHTPVIHM